MTSPNLEHLAILETALASPLGLVLQVSDFPRARAALYAARAASQDPRFNSLQIRSSGLPDGNLLITKIALEASPKASSPIDQLLELE